ncbi:hypothetical protein F2Q69_00010675 [Brassica cretica]|uniref:Uncharacterized protein n=1 Tax=Brassica cretica TaxID=69181 RepID=A0A8S9R4Z6_BRACR|nr:hypothetical protein F2Q69_00010675 [Brassica cretica]
MSLLGIGVPHGALETFGCIWSSKEVIRVIFGRALPRATSPERLSQVAPVRATYRSDAMKSLARNDPGATSLERHIQVTREETTRERRLQSDTARSLAKKRPGSDLSQRRAEVAPRLFV